MPKKPSKRSKAQKRPRRRTPVRAKNRGKLSEEEAFARSLVAHVQAAKADADGKLPPGATHELVENEKGELKPSRRRFSIV